MSAYIVDDETINKIVAYMYMESLGGRNYIYSLTQLREQGYNLSLEEDCIQLAEDMFALNVEAVEQRYGKGQAETFRTLDFKFRFVENEGIIKTIKALNEWLYQCLEGDVPETKLYKEMDELRNGMYAVFTHSTKEWKEAK